MQTARCPICNREVNVSNGRRLSTFPFCSERCRQADLGHWFGESYHVPVETNRVLRDAEFEQSEETDEEL